MTPLIPPHGGSLVDRQLHGQERQDLLERAHTLPRLVLSERSSADLECLVTGIYSPLEGFVSEEDYASIVSAMRLTNGLAWSVPITLQVAETESNKYPLDQDVALAHGSSGILAVMTVTSKYRPDQELEARRVYGTSDPAHPGVRAMLEAGTVYLGGPVSLVADLPKSKFAAHHFTPAQARAEFLKRGWRSVVAFQTRNPIHRAHEYLTKVALETVDGLFINPIVGTTKADDIPAEVRMRCYEVLLRDYYPKDRTLLGVYPAAMRYAGPREAILHAISRQNYGCSHFIVGRDHAGVGNYYGSYDAQRVFDEFSRDELVIIPLKFEHAFYCRKCETMGSTKSCPHAPEHHVHLSGSKVRELLARGEMPPAEFSRPEVASILIEAHRAMPLAGG